VKFSLLSEKRVFCSHLEKKGKILTLTKIYTDFWLFSALIKQKGGEKFGKKKTWTGSDNLHA